MSRKDTAKPKHFWDLDAAEREQTVKEFDKPLPASRIKPLSKKGQLLWNRAREAKKSQGDGTRTVTVRLDPDILEKSDEYAREHGMTRDELIARSLKSALAFAEG